MFKIRSATKTHLTAFALLLISAISFFSLLAGHNRLFNVSKGNGRAKMLEGAVRTVRKVVQGQKMMEGAGVRICRTLGTAQLRNLDPFLMLDELKCPSSEAASGFPDHPHRGFETCSIMINGKMEHKDSAGNHGVIMDGGVQWMTAGRGIVHSEMPVITQGDLWGFQLWINLPAKDKMVKPRYQDYQAADIPTVKAGPLSVRVMAGEFQGHTGPITLRNPGLLMDVAVAKGGVFELPFPAGWNAFCYVFDGSGSIGGTPAPLQHAVVLEAGDYVSATTDAEEGFRFLLVAGRPINEEIVQYGPFVMNSMEEIQQAFRDYQSGKLQNPDDDVWQAWTA